MDKHAMRYGLSVLILAVLLLAESSPAINVVTNFKSNSSENPTYDPNGQLLDAMMNSIEAYWEDIIEDSHTLTINFWWEDLSEENVLAVHQPTRVDYQGRETVCNIRFGTDWNWYIDADPADASEFNMTQTLYSDLSDTNQSAYYNGTVPDQLEVGYKGSAISSDLYSTIDLFSVALHEVGHSLGMTGAVAPNQVSDYDYDVNSSFVNGATMAINTYSTTDVYHAKDSYALMYPYTTYHTRTLPSATDVFAMASASNWTQIDLPRKDFWGGTDWNTAYNWEGNHLPDTTDEVSVQHGGAVTLNSQGDGDKLLIANGSELTVGISGTLYVDEITVTGQGNVHLDGGMVQGTSIVIDTDSSLTGQGTLTMNLLNQGVISPGIDGSQITLDGDFTQASTGSLLIDLGINSDLLAITGFADLAGELEINLASGFVPSEGDIFTVMTYGGLIDEFDVINNWLLGDGLYLQAAYQVTSLDLITCHAIPGDSNYDGLVDVGDLGILAANYGLSVGGTWEMGDFNDDGLVDVGDLGILAANYGESSAAIVGVPEPMSLLLLILSVMGRFVRKP